MRIVGAVLGVVTVVLLGVVGVVLLREAVAQGDSLVGPAALLTIPLLCAGAGVIAVLAAVVPWLRHGHEQIKGILVVALAAVLGLGVYAINRDVPVQRPDAAVTSAAARVCAAQPVAEAGVLHTDGSTGNHLVVLDPTGADHDWTGKPPIGWRPPNVADLELVACVDRKDTQDVEQVCRYTNGSTVTRMSATRNVRVVAARTGLELASFSIQRLPDSCPISKVMDQPDLTTSVDWPIVQAHLESFVRDGSFVDPDVVATQEEPGATMTPEPTLQPIDLGSEARAVTLQSALAAGLVTVKGIGDGLESLDLRVTSRTDEPLRIVVPAGTYLDPGRAATQTMVVISTTTIVLGARTTASEALEVACAQMHDDQPGASDTFTVRAKLATGDFRKLLASDAFGAAGFRIQQFAIWTVASNPTRSGYAGLGSFGVASGPSAAELRLIKSILKDAGIDPTDYRALK
jgi:hypothetical protein